MKIIVGLLLLCATWLQAASVQVTWDDPVNVGVTYRVHYGTAPGIYTNHVNVGASKTATIAGLANGARYFFAVTAVGAPGEESGFSNEVPHVTPLVPPVVRSVTNITQAAVSLNGPWKNVAMQVIDLPEGYNFARGYLAVGPKLD